MRNSRRQQRHHQHQDSDKTDRWVVSYADFITLLFAFFVVMYAMSTINEGKYRVLADNLLDAFNTPPKSAKPIQVGEESQHPSEMKTGQPEKNVELVPKQNVDPLQLARIAEDVRKAMQPLINEDMIKVRDDRLWVEVEVNTELLFTSGSADLVTKANPVLTKLAQVLQPLSNHIDVEGHTDNLPIKTSIYPSNWELSASRAASVVHLFMQQGIDPDRLAAIGYGEYRPVADNSTPEGRRANRRVKIVILADKNARRAVEIDREIVKDR